GLRRTASRSSRGSSARASRRSCSSPPRGLATHVRSGAGCSTEAITVSSCRALARPEAPTTSESRRCSHRRRARSLGSGKWGAGYVDALARGFASEPEADADRHPPRALGPEGHGRGDIGSVPMLAADDAADDNSDERASGDCEDVLDSAQLVPVAAPAYNRTRSESHECAPQEAANDAGRPASLAAHAGAGADVQSRPRRACKRGQCAVAATHHDGVAVDRLECARGAPVSRRDANAVARGGGRGGRALGGEAIHRKAEDDGERAMTDRVHRIPPPGGTSTGPKWASRPRVSEGNLRDSSS